MKSGKAVMPAWVSQIRVAKAVSHSLRSLTPVTQRKPTKPNRAAAGAFGNDLLVGNPVVLLPRVLLGGCKNFRPMFVSSCSGNTVIADVDKDKSMP